MSYSFVKRSADLRAVTNRSLRCRSGHGSVSTRRIVNGECVESPLPSRDRSGSVSASSPNGCETLLENYMTLGRRPALASDF